MIVMFTDNSYLLVMCILAINTCPAFAEVAKYENSFILGEVFSFELLMLKGFLNAFAKADFGLRCPGLHLASQPRIDPLPSNF